MCNPINVYVYVCVRVCASVYHRLRHVRTRARMPAAHSLMIHPLPRLCDMHVSSSSLCMYPPPSLPLSLPPSLPPSLPFPPSLSLPPFPSLPLPPSLSMHTAYSTLGSMGVDVQGPVALSVSIACALVIGGREGGRAGRREGARVCCVCVCVCKNTRGKYYESMALVLIPLPLHT